MSGFDAISAIRRGVWATEERPIAERRHRAEAARLRERIEELEAELEQAHGELADARLT